MVEVWDRSVAVCPPCAWGDHVHHRLGDCKNEIPGGQCMCYDGAEDKMQHPKILETPHER